MSNHTRFLVVILAAGAACSDPPTGDSGPVAPSLKPGSSSPPYTVLTPPVAPGWTAFSPWDINVLHQAVGVMNPVGNNGQMARRAAWWQAGSSAVPEVLPVPAGKTWSVAVGVSDNGIIGGHIFPAGVLWKPNGGGWDIVTLDDHAVVNDVRNDGSAAGTVYEPALRHLPRRRSAGRVGRGRHTLRACRCLPGDDGPGARRSRSMPRATSPVRSSNRRAPPTTTARSGCARAADTPRTSCRPAGLAASPTGRRTAASW